MEIVGSQLEFLSEPTLIVDLKGRVRGGNSAADGLLGVRGEAANLFDFVVGDREEVAAYLRRASGSSSSLFGAITIVNAGKTERFRTFAARRQGGEDIDTTVIVRLMPARDDQFSILNRRLSETNQQLRGRLKENALLQEALSANRLLVRELQHRVKNCIQQMASLINMSAMGRASPEVAAVVRSASDRLQAMASAQEALYQNEGERSISAGRFLEEVARRTASSYGALERLKLSIADEAVTSDEAHCLSLITNELVTNACKHGLDGPAGEVSVTFAAVANGRRLEVRDTGPGFEEGTTSRSSGLMLVRGLCRQIGARLDVGRDNGAICAVSFQSALGPRENGETAGEKR